MDHSKLSELRARATRLLAEGGLGKLEVDNKNPEGLLEELLTYHAELEIQNSELREAQESLEISRNRYFELFDLAPVGYVTLDRTGVILEANFAAAEMLEIGRSFLKNAPLSSMVAAGYKDIFFLHLEQVSHSKNRADCEILLRKSDGSTFCVRMTSSSMESSLESQAKVLTTLVDVTERKHAEEALREAEDRYRHVSSITSDVAYSCLKHSQGDYLIDWIAGATERITGYSGDELKALGCWRSLVIAEDLPIFDTHVAGIASGMTDSCQLRLRHKAGGLAWVHASNKCVFDSSSKDSLRLYGGITDISDSVKAEQQKEALQAQLLQSQKMEAVGNLAAGIAHDFNNMLQIILGYSDVLLMGKKEGEPGRAELQKIVKTAQEARELVHKIRIFSRKADLKFGHVDLNHQIREVMKLFPHILPKNIRENIYLGDAPGLIKADPALLDQMVVNLALNAVEAMPDGGVLTIRTENVLLDDRFCKSHGGADPGSYMRITFSDTGAGMSKEILDRIYDPFFSTKQRDYHRGTGLGLSVVHGIVEQHGGLITVQSELGKGTTFNIYFPHLSPEDTPKLQKKKDFAAGGAETILLVEDEALVRDLGATILQGAGYKVLEAADGKEALEVYSKGQDTIALVILDIVMPRMDGKECLEELMKIDPSVKVLISSGVALDGAIRDIEELGAKGSLIKPYSIKALLETVREILESDD